MKEALIGLVKKILLGYYLGISIGVSLLSIRFYLQCIIFGEKYALEEYISTLIQNSPILLLLVAVGAIVAALPFVKEVIVEVKEIFKKTNE